MTLQGLEHGGGEVGAWGRGGWSGKEWVRK